MFENIRDIYRFYGGLSATIKSGYFWCAMVLSLLSFQSAKSLTWIDISIAIIPSLSGFTIAAFAIIFSILGQQLFTALSAPGPDGSSPMVKITAAIAHAVFIQILSVVLAVVFKIGVASDLISTMISCFSSREQISATLSFTFFVVYFGFSFLGLLFTYYGIILVLAAIFSIFRMQLIVTKTRGPRSSTSPAGAAGQQGSAAIPSNTERDPPEL